MVLSVCQCGKKTAVPDDLIGVWETTAPTYADRFFEIKTDEVIFGTGEGKLRHLSDHKDKNRKRP